MLAMILGLQLCNALLASPTFAQTVEILNGPPNLSPLSPHVELPSFGGTTWPLDCSAWPENPPSDGYLASIFGHREHGGGADFHRGADYRCDPDGDTCCRLSPTDFRCGQTDCSAGGTEVQAPVVALVGGTVETVHDGVHNNLVVRTDRPLNDISVGATNCNVMYTWYQHMRQDYAINEDTKKEWKVGDKVERDDPLGWQGNSGANTVHLHVSIRLCSNNRADGITPPVLDPEMNPFQLIGSDNGQAPDIRQLETEQDGADLLVTVQIETDDPDFDQLEITVYDAPNDRRHVRRLGYNSRFGINVAAGNLDTFLLQPDGESELTALQEPDPPAATSGFTLTARFVGLSLTADPDSRAQVKVADVFGNTSIEEIQIFGTAEVGNLVWQDNNDNGLQDAGEPGIGGLEVELYRSGGLFESTITDPQGLYNFDELPAGSYSLRFERPVDHGATVQVGGSPATDSNIDPQTNETPGFSLGSGQIDTSLDAGFTPNCSQVSLVGFTSEWKTSDTYTPGWNMSSFDDSSWDELQADLGFPQDDVYSLIPNTGLTSYFRLVFDVDDVTLFDTLDLSLFRDDGAVVYLNGTEVMRSNMPAGPISHHTEAASNSEDTDSANIPASHLLNGTNVLAVEVHNRGGSADLIFDLELRSLVCRSCLTETTLTSSVATYLEADDPDDNMGDDDEIKIKGGNERSGLLLWDSSSLPPSAKVLHAELVLHVTNDSSDAYPIYAMSRAWNEEEATWKKASGDTSNPVLWQAKGANGANDRSDTPLGLVRLKGSTPMTGTVVLNVSGRSVVEDWINGSLANHGLMINGDPNQSGTLKFSSDDDTNDPAPMLRLVYASGCTP